MKGRSQKNNKHIRKVVRKRMRMYFKKGQLGFTLIELLVVIAIIGVLAGLILISLNSARQKSRDAQRKSHMADLQLALELYSDDKGSLYPPNEPDVGGASTDAERYDTGLGGAVLVPAYLKSLPKDPTNSGSNVYEYRACDGDADSTGGTNYELNAVFENTADDTDTNAKDGGSDDDVYEVGTKLTCIP